MRVSVRVYAFLLRLYPPAFRREYGTDMVRDFRDWEAAAHGPGRPVRFWAGVTRDILRSASREWGSALASWVARVRHTIVRRVGVRRPADPHPPPYSAAAAAGLGVFALYVVTLAPSIGFWDSGEYVTAAHILGIPHPPGNPLFVLLGRGWDLLLAPLGLSVAVRMNLFSAALSAGAHVFWFLVVDRALAGWTDHRLTRRLGAGAAVLLSATAFTVWSQSNVTEKVYPVSLFTTALLAWLALRWRDRAAGTPAGGMGRLLVMVFLVVITATNHLMGVLVAPALVLFVTLVDPRPLLRARFWVGAVPLMALGLSVTFFLPIRAAQHPLIAEGSPECASAAGAAESVYTLGWRGCSALSDVLTRAQYPERKVSMDPTDQALPRGPAMVAAQLVNWLQYFDWQWARSVGGRDPLFGGARPMITLVFLLLGLLGIRTHWRSDRRSAVFLGTLFLTLSLGLVLYLNFKYGYSIARDRFPGSDMHEVRERDYFFMLGFSVWGLWAGMGLAAAWRWLAEAVDHALGTHRPGPARSRLRTTIPARWGLPSPRLLAAPVLALALLPLALNWSWASRADDWTARDWAYNVLMSVEPYGILVTNGDNDSFPLWYLQNVEGIREDVTIVLSPYLNTPWYARQIRDLTRPCPTGVSPGDHPTRIVCQRPFRPDRLPAPLKALGWATGVKPPGDSILGLTDEQIDRIAGGYYVTPRAMTFQAGGLMVTIPAGTPMSPADTFTAVILQAAAGERPIHFMPGSPHVSTLGLSDHTVRQGLTWRIDNGEPAFRGPAGRAAGVVALPKTGLSSMGGAAVDLVTTDTLLRHVFLRRGRILDPELQWTDPANTDIPYQYVVANYVLAQAFALRGDNAAAREGQRRGAWWEALVTGE